MHSNRPITIFLFVQGFAIGRLSKRYSDRQFMLSSAIAMAAGFAFCGATTFCETLSAIGAAHDVRRLSNVGWIRGSVYNGYQTNR